MNNIRHPRVLRNHIREQLAQQVLGETARIPPVSERKYHSAVLLALTAPLPEMEPCLVLNKRSGRVRQPGDLCYPGGGVGRWDRALAGFQRLPPAHFYRWKSRSGRRGVAKKLSRHLELMLTTCLRESWEEMRLNPLGVSFLGPLPVQRLVMFNRAIHPMVGWIHRQKRFKPNWEVDRIVMIPLDHLLDARRYGRYRIDLKPETGPPLPRNDFPCFIFQGTDGREILWGASFHITMSFLSLCFGFVPPPHENLPVVEKQLSPSYFNGASSSIQMH